MADLIARIKPKKSSVAGEVPAAGDLEVSEIAVNTADGKLFTKHTDNSIKTIGGGGVTSINSKTGAVTLGVEDLSNAKPLGVAPTFLLNMNGSNGGTTFTDSSSNAFTVTPSSGTTTSTTQVKYGTASAYASSTTHNLSVTGTVANNIFGFGSGDFTVEAWVYPTQSTTGACVYRWGISDSIAPSSALSMDTTAGILIFDYSTNGTSSTFINGTAVGSLVNAWHHVAVARQGSTIRGFVDGVQVFSQAISGSLATPTSWPAYMMTQNNGTNTMLGYMDDFRVVKGTAIYTTAFTPPTSQLSAVAGPTEGQTLTWDSTTSKWSPEDRRGAIQFVGATTSQDAVFDQATLTLSLPANLKKGDLILLSVGHRSGAGGTTTSLLNTPSGYTKRLERTYASSTVPISHSLFTKVSTGSETSVSVTAVSSNAGDDWYASIQVYRNAEYVSSYSEDTVAAPGGTQTAFATVSSLNDYNAFYSVHSVNVYAFTGGHAMRFAVEPGLMTRHQSALVSATTKRQHIWSQPAGQFQIGCVNSTDPFSQTTAALTDGFHLLVAKLKPA